MALVSNYLAIAQKRFAFYYFPLAQLNKEPFSFLYLFLFIAMSSTSVASNILSRIIFHKNRDDHHHLVIASSNFDYGCFELFRKQKGEEYSDNDNVDYFDEYERIHNTLYQNGYLQHVFNSSDLTASNSAAVVTPTTAATITATAPLTSAATMESGASSCTSENNNQTASCETLQQPNSNSNKTMEITSKNTSTLSSKSSSSNQSELLNLLPHYQPRWHQQLMHSSFALRNPLHPSIIKAHLDSVNHEIAQLDSRIESILLKQHQAMNQQALADAADSNATTTIYRSPVDAMNGGVERKANGTPANSATTTTAPMAATNNTTVISASPTAAALDNKFANMNVSNSANHSQQMTGSTKSMAVSRRYPTQYPPQMDSDTEHIYETIPEDSESEPIYCSPYRGETDSEQNLVHEWLNIKGDGPKRCNDTKGNWTRSTKSNSSIEDHENSSSAYNTGGSCNSNHQLTLELSDTNNDDGNKTLVFCPTKHLKPKFPATQNEIKSPIIRSSSTKKEKPLSPTHRRSEYHNEPHGTRKSPSNNQGNK